MRFMTLSALASTWLLLSPAIWDYRPANAILAAAVGLLTLALSPMGIVWAPARRAIAWSGLLLGLSSFAFHDGIGLAANHAVVGLCLLFAGLGPAPRSSWVQAAGRQTAPAQTPIARERSGSVRVDRPVAA